MKSLVSRLGLLQRLSRFAGDQPGSDQDTGIFHASFLRAVEAAAVGEPVAE